jgi:hypothetical protein
MYLMNTLFIIPLKLTFNGRLSNLLPTGLSQLLRKLNRELLYWPYGPLEIHQAVLHSSRYTHRRTSSISVLLASGLDLVQGQVWTVDSLPG